MPIDGGLREKLATGTVLVAKYKGTEYRATVVAGEGGKRRCKIAAFDGCPGNAGPDLHPIGPDCVLAKFVDPAKPDDVGWLEPVEIHFDHGVCAAGQEAGAGISRKRVKGLAEGRRHRNAHAGLQPENASIMALTSPSGYRIGHVQPLAM